jgi:hypothetical protein
VYTKLDLLGVRLDPSIVWNAIPFTFVVDWVVDVGSFLGSFARDNYPIETRITDFCHSYSWRKELCVETVYGDRPDLSAATYGSTRVVSDRFHPLYTGSRSYYNRVRANPDIHTIRLKAPKLRQAALAGSLLLARTSFGRSNGYQNLSKLPLRKIKKK